MYNFYVSLKSNLPNSGGILFLICPPSMPEGGSSVLVARAIRERSLVESTILHDRTHVSDIPTPEWNLRDIV